MTNVVPRTSVEGADFELQTKFVPDFSLLKYMFCKKPVFSLA